MDRLDSLIVFAAVADQQSFAGAARQLNRSPAAVTRAVAGLEDTYRVRLLHRSTRAVSLTEAGLRFLETARRILAEIEELDTITEETGSLRGSISLTAPSMFGRMHVLPLVQSFLAQHQSVRIRFMLMNRVVSLVDEGLDLAVRIGQLPDSSLRAIRVGAVQESIFASPAYLARAGVPASPRDLPEHSIVACTAITAVPDRWSFPGIGPVNLHPQLVVNTTEAAVDAALAGLGLTFIVSYQAAPHLVTGRLVRVLAPFEGPPEPVHVVHPAGRHLPARVRALLGHLTDGLRQIVGIPPYATESIRQT